jgi:GT2 family glycosyltransferase
MITISIVSHGHGHMVKNLIKQLLCFPEVSQIILTKNIPEPIAIPDTSRLLLIENLRPKGFGANHNYAFSLVETRYFCPLNPDIEFNLNPFPELIDLIFKTEASLIAPLVFSLNGELEDSIREFPTFKSLVLKFLNFSEGRYENVHKAEIFYPDWVAGMFMLLTSKDFKAIGGFDEAYFLYYEDVDLCRRLKLDGLKVVTTNLTFVIHNAQRTSRRNLKYMYWHMLSMVRFLLS